MNGGVISNAVTFTMPNPQITSISPTSGAVGTQITITGAGFGAAPGTASVNWRNATVQSWSDTQIVATVAPGTTTGGVRVVNSGLTSNAVTFTMPNPQISSVSPTIYQHQPDQRRRRDADHYHGHRLWSNAGRGERELTVQSWSDTQIVAAVAPGTTTGGVRVVNGGVTSNAVTFTMPNPQITSISPTSGAVGTQITITGMGFGAAPGAASVNWTNATIGPVGTQITITGTRFGATTNTARVNWRNATIQSWSDTQIVATVVPGSTTGGVRVVNGGVTSNPVTFIVGTPGFSTTGSMSTGRIGATATVLENGSVLIVGGTDSSGNVLASAEIYNPTSGAFTSTGGLNTGRTAHTATLLSNGTVLIAGGYDVNGNCLASTEIYNSATGTFTLTGNLTTPRDDHTATLLNDGTLLMAGGKCGTSTAELYDPATQTAVSLGSMVTGRSSATATRLNNGDVLIAGGIDSNGNTVAGAELYDPVAGTLTATGSLNVARANHTATLLNNGNVLVAGGFDASGNASGSAELYNSSAGAFTSTGNLLAARGSQTATLLNNGQVLVAGGRDSSGNALASAELYDPVAGTFSSAGNLTTGRGSQAAVLLTGGQVLLAGGAYINKNALTSAELYQPASLTPAGLASISIAPYNPSFTAGTSQPFTATGMFNDGSTEELASVTWSVSDNSVAAATNDATNSGSVWGLGAGPATINACAGSLCGSTSLLALQGPPPQPAISSLSPTSGPSGSYVAITGTDFGASQGHSQVLFGSTAAGIVSWSNTLVVAVAPSSIQAGQSVPVQLDVWATGISNNTPFTATSVTSSTYRASPQALNMLVGQSRTVSITDTSGNPVTGLTWTSSNPEVVSLSSDDPPIITAVAPGNSIVQVAGLAIPVTVYAGTSLPAGTPQWTSPGDGSGVNGIVPAVPSDSGVDIFAMQASGRVAAIRNDGTTAWTAPAATGATMVADFQGGVVLLTSNSSTNNSSIWSLAGSTGQAYPAYTSASGVTLSSPLAATDGTVFTEDSNGNVIGIDPSTGQPKFSVPLPSGSISVNYNNGPNPCWDPPSSFQNPLQGPDPGGTGRPFASPFIGGDGYAYFPYGYMEGTENQNGWCDIQENATGHIGVLRVGTDGSSSTIELKQWTYTYSMAPTNNQCCILAATQSAPMPTIGAGSGITNADSGTTVTWEEDTPAYCASASDDYNTGQVTTSGCQNTASSFSLATTQGTSLASTTTTNISGEAGPLVPMVQRADGSYVGTVGIGPQPGQVTQTEIVAFSADGTVLWQQAVNGTQGAIPLYATADGGVIAGTAPVGQPSTFYTLDQNGNLVSQTAAPGAMPSWTGDSYASTAGGISDLGPSPFVIEPASYAAQPGGNPSLNGTADVGCPCLLQSTNGASSTQSAAPLSAQPSSATAQDLAAPSPATSDPVNCPICNLPQPTPQCLTASGTGPTYLILVGDPGITGTSGINHNVTNLFNLSAQTEMNNLTSLGDTVVACRVSTIEQFDGALTGTLQGESLTGQITGGVIYFGHSGLAAFVDDSGKAEYASEIFVGQAKGLDTNIAAYNVSTLANVQQAYSGQNIMGTNAAMLINGCNAAWPANDYYAHQVTTIAQMIANNIRRGVYAYVPGMYFSQLDAAHDPYFDRKDQPPNALPMYMDPVGKPGHKPGPVGFRPQ